MFFQHPVTRFITKYIPSGYQKNYEKYLDYAFRENEKREMRQVSIFSYRINLLFANLLNDVLSYILTNYIFNKMNRKNSEKGL